MDKSPPGLRALTSPRLRGEVAEQRDAGEGLSATPQRVHHRRKQANEKLVTRSRELRKDCSDAEERLWGSLRNRKLKGLKFRRQYAIGGFIADFACAEAGLIVEVDGTQHAFDKPRDEARTLWLNKLGYRVIRFWTIEVMQQLDAVLMEIWKVAAGPAMTRNPSPGANAPTSPRKRGEVRSSPRPLVNGRRVANTLTSPRLRGEVAEQRDAGEGLPVQPKSGISRQRTP